MEDLRYYQKTHKFENLLRATESNFKDVKQ